VRTAVARGGGWPLLETYNFAAALALNVLLCLWLVPRYGPIGAAFAMAVSYGLAGAWLIVMMHRRLQVPNAPWLARLALPRFLLPAVAAALLWRLWPGAAPEGKLAPMTDAPRIVLKQHWHRKANHDARNRWLRVLVSEIFTQESDEWKAKRAG
jgi:hypothetical protein